MTSSSFVPLYSGLSPEFGSSIGQYRGWISQNKFAYNGSVGTSYEDVWAAGGTESYLTSAETMITVSTDGNDKGVATALSGARTLQIYGLDSNYDEINEIVTLNGTSNVTTSNSYLRVYRAIVRSAGSTGSNEGVISLTSSSSGYTHASISIGDNQTLKSQYTVPNGYYMILNNVSSSCAKSDQIEVRLEERPLNEVFQVKQIFQVFQQTIQVQFIPSKIFSPKSDIRMRAKNIGGSTVSMTAAYDFILVPENQVNI